MNNEKFTQLLISARPLEYASSAGFTEAVMSRVRSTEILSAQVRKMSVNKKETRFMKLRHIPKFAIIALALAVVVLLSGTTYALYKLLWEKPSITLEQPTINQYGRTQVIASFDNCGDQTAAATYEVKNGSTLDISEIGKILQARCELDLIRDWSGANSFVDNEGIQSLRTPKEGISTATDIMVSPVASKVVSISDTALSLTGDEYNSPKEPLALTSNTIYIVDNQLSTQDQIKPGDSVTYVQNITTKRITTKTATGYSTSGTAVDQATTTVIKMDLPFEYYGPSKQNQIAQRQACDGNPKDSCVQTASVDLYESPDTYTLKTDSSGNYTNEMRSIQGILTEYNGNVLKIKSSSGRIFTFITPNDVVASFNQNRSVNYNNTKVAIGDLLIANYIVDKGYKSLSLDKTQIISINLALNLIQKSDPIKKY